jgi:large subunit ribosomal protein L24
MRKIRTGDTVVVITGKDKGKTGVILKVMAEQQRVVVADINMRTRHMPKTQSRAGQIMKYEASIHWSNVMLLDPKTKKRTRVGFKFDEKGNATRIAKRSGEAIVAVKAASQPKKKPVAEAESVKAPAAAKKGPFWKKIGFGNAEMADRAEVDGPTHMQVDHTVPDQIERQTGRSASRGT